MKILFLAPRFPLPADTGGKIRTFNILKQLAKGAELHLVCFSFDKEDKELCPELENIGIKITLVPVSDPGIITKIMQALFDPLPVSIAKYGQKNMEDALASLNKSDHFDVVHVDHLHMAHYLKCFNGTPSIIDEHNVEYKILERCAHVEKSLIKKIVFKDQARKMKVFEAQRVKDFSAYLAVSEDDKNLLDGLGTDPSSGHVVPNGVDTEFFKAPESQRSRVPEEEAVVFTGSMDWFPNDDAAIYFCKDILPHIWKVHSNVKFYIVGKGPSSRLKALARSDRRIVLTGRVDDVRVFVARSKVFVVPLRIGGGTRLKILEAMSMEKAIVSTSIGAEGIHYTQDTDIVLADRPETFAQKVVSLINDSKQCELLGTAGRKLVLEQYDWNIIGRKLADINEKIKK